MDFKVGDKVLAYKVVPYMGSHGIVVEREIFTVEGDSKGEPLCLRLDLPDKKRTGFASYGSQAFHFHDVSFTEGEAIRRWRASKLLEAVKAEQRAKELRDELDQPIRRRDLPGRYVPQDDDQVKMRFEDR